MKPIFIFLSLAFLTLTIGTFVMLGISNDVEVENLDVVSNETTEETIEEFSVDENGSNSFREVLNVKEKSSVGPPPVPQ